MLKLKTAPIISDAARFTGSFTNITAIIIPSSLETIGDVFIFPTTISDVQITGGNNEHFAVENGCLYNGDKTELIMCFTKNSEVDIADTVTTIKAYSFRQATNIENVTFDGNITTIQGLPTHKLYDILKDINKTHEVKS